MFLRGFVLAVVLLTGTPAIAEYRLDFTIDMPADDGSPVGSLFNVGGNLAGAGFTYATGSTRTANPRTLTFFAEGGSGATTSDLGKPFTDSENFNLVTMGDELIAVSYSEILKKPRKYVGSQEWQDLTMPDWTQGTTRLGGFLVVNGKPLYLYANGDLHYDGSAVAGDDRWVGKNTYQMAYVGGRIYVFAYTGDTTYIYIATWAPGDAAVTSGSETDLGRDSWSYANWPTKNGLAFGDSKGWVQTISSSGAVSTQRTTDGTSFQLYGSLKGRGERWWIGHYPTGNLLRLDNLEQMSPGIGKQACSTAWAREAQSVGISMGQPIAGVWPWGEIWTGIPGSSWSLLVRIFPYPASTCTVDAPFMAEAEAVGVDYNALGQRVHSIASFGGGFAVAATMKHAAYGTALNQLSASERAAYGTVTLIKRDYEISCEITGSGEMTLSFILTNDTMQIMKDDIVQCTRPIDGATIADMEHVLPVSIGDGPWGSFAGDIIRAEINR